MMPEADYDSPWKEALEQYLPQCLALFLPQVHADIDWSRDFAFLDTELQRVTPESAIGRRVVDKLAQVRRRDGEDALVLLHIEVQNQEEPDFARRMFGYYSRLLDHFDQAVVSVAILGDDRPMWRPAAFQQALWGCDVAFRFPVIKLTDYRPRMAELEASENPFAGVVMAHLRAIDTRRDAPERRIAKFGMVRWLYTRGYGREDVLKLFRLIDWFLRLPREAEQQFVDAVRAYEEAQQVAYITSVERIGMERGLEQGRRNGLLIAIEQFLTARFGESGRAMLDEVRGVEDPAVLEAVVRRLATATTIEDVRQVYQRPREEGAR